MTTKRNKNNYLNPAWLFVELPGDEEDVVTVTTDDDLDDVDVLCTSTNPVLFILLEFTGIEVDECCFKNSHKSPPRNPSPGKTHSLTTQTGSPWLHAASIRAMFGWFGRSHELRISDINDWL